MEQRAFIRGVCPARTRPGTREQLRMQVGQMVILVMTPFPLRHHISPLPIRARFGEISHRSRPGGHLRPGGLFAAGKKSPQTGFFLANRGQIRRSVFPRYWCSTKGIFGTYSSLSRPEGGTGNNGYGVRRTTCVLRIANTPSVSQHHPVRAGARI